MNTRTALPRPRIVADDERQSQTLLVLVLALLVRVALLALLVGLEEQDLRNALVGINLRGQRRRVADLDGDLAAPFRLQRRDIDDDAAAGVGRFTQTGRKHVARNL